VQIRKLAVIRVFVAEGESAWDTDRPVFEERLDFIQKNKGRVSVLCVQDISRQPQHPAAGRGNGAIDQAWRASGFR